MRDQILQVMDFCLVPFVYPAGLLLKSIRAAGVHRLPRSKRAMLRTGVFPIRNHYYEPLFDLKPSEYQGQDRILPGIDWNVGQQLELLRSFSFEEEVKNLPAERTDDLTFYLRNGRFGVGDAEYWYQLIRLKKPSRILEIGSGFSTLMASMAIRKNREECDGYCCEHICVEPYEMKWLERLELTVIRRRVEDLELSTFSVLNENDILFIDSSHVIRPQGDVVFEYLQILPTLNKGVIVHVHDIYSPRNYPRKWICDEVRLWNEQYLLEAFLTSNRDWKIVGALNFLQHHFPAELKSKCPSLSGEREPGSFYIQKIG